MKLPAVLAIVLVCLLASVVNVRSQEANKQGRRVGRKGKNNGGCVYNSGTWGDCNTDTGMVVRTKTLKRGPTECQQTLTETRRCKNPKKNAECKYSKEGTWSECDSVTLKKTKVKKLRSGPSSCNATVAIQKPCKIRTPKMKCKYNKGSWTPCTMTAPYQKTRTDTLRTEISHTTCEATKTKTKPCKGPGKIKCKFGQWSKWSKCEDGVRTKRRSIVSGGDKCQSRSVKTKEC